MAKSSDRLKRYLDTTLEECGSEDIQKRLDELESLREALNTEQIKAEREVLASMANQTRYTLLCVLTAAERELCVCELNAVVDVSESGLSHALSDLEKAGLIEGRKDGRWKHFRATKRAIAICTVVKGSVTVNE